MFGEYTNTNTDSHITDSVSADFASTHFYTLSHLVRHCCFCCCLLFISRYTQIERELNRHRLNLIMLIQLKYKMILIEWTCMEHLNMGDLIIAQKLHQPKNASNCVDLEDRDSECNLLLTQLKNSAQIQQYLYFDNRLSVRCLFLCVFLWLFLCLWVLGRAAVKFRLKVHCYRVEYIIVRAER